MSRETDELLSLIETMQAAAVQANSMALALLEALTGPVDQPDEVDHAYRKYHRAKVKYELAVQEVDEALDRMKHGR
jgi:hypothetical protein